MALTLRSASTTIATTKGAALSHAEMDANWLHVLDASNQSFLQSGSGATARSVQDRLRDSVSVWDFLSAAEKADVIAETRLVDVTSSFQKACNAAAGKTLYVPPGKYSFKTAGGIVLTSRVKIVGDGFQSTFIYRDFSPASDDIGAFNMNVRNGSIIEDLSIQSGTGTTGGCLVSIVSTAGVAASFHRLHNVDLTFESADTYKYALYVDGSLKTTASVGARNIHLDNVIAFGGTSGAAFIKSVVEFFWSGYTAPGGSTSGSITITGTADVDSSYVNIRATCLDDVVLDFAEFVNFYGYIGGDVTNTADVRDSMIFGKVDGSLENDWVRSGLNGEIKGTWTPVLTFTTPGDLSVAYTTQLGAFTRNGDTVTIDFRIQTSTFTHTTASGAVRITGLPYESANTGINRFGALSWRRITKANYTDVNAYVANNSSVILLKAMGSGQSESDVSAADMPTAGTVVLEGSITYEADPL